MQKSMFHTILFLFLCRYYVPFSFYCSLVLSFATFLSRQYFCETF
nr:MAG TPA: hypothetical protein [Caudoviricetes sp.]